MSEQRGLPIKQRIYLWLGSHVAGNCIRLLKKTVRLTVIGEENLNFMEDNGGRAIFTSWHGNMIVPMMKLYDQGVIVLVSEHSDGEIIARVLKSLGYSLVRGSTTRGGARALIEMKQFLKSPGIIVITPDGPKGPYRQLKIGVVLLAQRTSVPIVPMSSYTSKPTFLNSWDRFHVVRPFVRCVLFYGKPIIIDRDLCSEELEEKRILVEQTVKELDQRAETYFD